MRRGRHVAGGVREREAEANETRLPRVGRELQRRRRQRHREKVAAQLLRIGDADTAAWEVMQKAVLAEAGVGGSSSIVGSLCAQRAVVV